MKYDKQSGVGIKFNDWSTEKGAAYLPMPLYQEVFSEA